MKLTTHRMVYWRNFGLRALVMILGLMMAAAVVSAQESKPAGEAPKSAEAQNAFDAPKENEPDGQRPMFVVSLEPATPLVKQVVEFFGPRGMTAIEEGNTLTIAATNKEVVKDFYELMQLVGQELKRQKQAEPEPKPAAEKTSAVGLEPATPLAKSLVELFGPRGAKVLEFEAGKRLKVEAPGDVFVDLEKMLKLVANETEADSKMPDISGKWTYKTPDLPIEELKGTTISLVEINVVSRSEEAGIDFMMRDSESPKEKAMPFRWMPETRRFQAVDETNKSKLRPETLELSSDGKVLKFRSNVDDAERKRLATEGGVSVQTMHRLLNQDWRRVESDAAVSGEEGPLVPSSPKPVASRESQTKMPDISGKWTYTPPDLPPDDVTGALIAPPETFVVRRSTQAGIDFELLGTRVPKAAPTQLKWEPGTRRFRKVPLNDTGKEEATLELSTDGNQLSVRYLRVGVLDPKGGFGAQPIERYVTQEWRRDVADKVAVPTPLKEPASTPTSDKDSTAKMPDIVGTWFVYQRGHVVNNTGTVKRPLNPALRSIDDVAELVIQRSADGSADFVEKPADGAAAMWRIKWSEPTQRFEWKWDGDPTNNYKYTMMVLPDGKTSRVRITQTKKEGSNDGKRSEAEAEYFEEWSREKNLFVSLNAQVESQEILAKETFDGLAFFSKPLGKWSHLRIPRPEFSLLLSQTITGHELTVTKTDEALYAFSCRTGRIAKLPIPKELRDPNKNWPVLSATSATVELGNEVYVITAQSGEWSSPNSPAPANNHELRTAPDPVSTQSSPALPDTPAAKQLVEQLAAQESAAAAEAATIRQLQANGQAESNQQPIAEHQRKLKNLLSTAFDLKLQLEELQVKELQSRLSRLERQIGQRKELREKIINRRAGELIEGDALRWDSTVPASTKLLGSAVGNTTKPATPEVLSSSSTAAPPPKADQIVIDLYAGSQVLPGLGMNPGYSKLVQSLNALKGVTVNFRETGRGDVIVMAIVRDTLQGGQLPQDVEHARKAFALRAAIHSALEAAGIESVRWEKKTSADKEEDRSADKTETQTETSKPNASQSNAASVLSTQINFTGPAGMQVTIAGEPWELIAPGRHNFVRDTSKTLRYDLGFMKAPGAPDRQFAALLDIYPSTTETQIQFGGSLLPATDEFLRHNSVPITITEADTRHASNELLIKVVCLSKTSSVEAAIPEIKTFDSTNITRGLDVIGVAPQFGTILAVLRLAANADQLGKLEPKSSNTSVTSPRTASQPDPLPSPEQLREQLEPFAKRVTAAEGRVRELEDVYFRDRSNAAELQRAFEEMTEARFEIRSRLRKYVPTATKRLDLDLASAKSLVDALSAQHREKLKSLSEGKSTGAEVKAVSDSWKQAIEATAALEAKLLSYGNLAMQLTSLASRLEEIEDPLAFGDPPAVAQPGYHPDVALAWLEAATYLKLEFVPLDDLKLPFKAALRIREANGEYTTNDLIVALCGQRFDSLDQAVVALRPSTSYDPPSSLPPNTVLRGGLAGRPQQLAVHHRSWPIDYLEPTPANTDIPFEVRVRKKEGADAVTEYVTGVCVSPNGLVVIPVSARTLVEGEAIVPFGRIKGTVRVMASDDKHGLTLVKLELPQPQLLPWIKCRSGMPAVGQRLSLSQGTDRDTKVVSVIELNRSFEKLLVGNDGFTVTTTTSWQVRRGSPLVSVEGELQGIVAFSALNSTDNELLDGLTDRSAALPAVHIQKLLDEYRRSTAKQKPQGPPKTVSSPLGAKTLDDWLAVLRARGSSDSVALAIREILRLAPSAAAERAASALLAASEYSDGTIQTDANDHALILAMRKLDLSGKTPAIVRALRDGPQRVRLFALACFESLQDATATKDFPALVEQVLKIAAGEEPLPRLISLRLLGETLPITRLDPKEFTTEERRELARRLVEFVPRDRVLQLLVTTMSDKQIDPALTAALQLAKQPEDSIDAQTQKKCLDLLASVTKGKLGETTASSEQRQRAFDGLASLGRRAAPVIPTLIELLKSDDADLKANEAPRPSVVGVAPTVANLTKFTRSQIIQVIRNMGPAAKSSLPELEATVPILEKKEQEDALLSPKSPKTSPPHSDQLRNAIDHIKIVGTPTRT